MAYLLDTNIVSRLVREPGGPIEQRIEELGRVAACTSVIVAAELRYGAIRRNSQRLRQQLEAILAKLRVLPFEAPADEVYGQIRTRLERAGTPISAMDMLIAAHALAFGHTLVTDNEREFRRIEELPVENWLRPPG